MTPLKTLFALVTALGLVFTATAAQDPSQYRLTPETLRKLEAADADAKQAAAKNKKTTASAEDDAQGAEDSDDDADAEADDEADDETAERTETPAKKDQTVEGIARKVDADPQLRALLQRHGLGSMDYALSVHAMLHAGMFLMFEQSMPKEKARELFNGYTGAQQANIELLRQSAMLKK